MVPRVVHISQSKTLGGIAVAVAAELACADGVDVSWHTVNRSPVTRELSPLLHRALYGSGAEQDLADEDPWPRLREFGEQEAPRLADVVAGADLLVLHDPLCLSLAPRLRPLAGAVLWRCHIGNDVRGADTDAVIAGLFPYLEAVDKVAFLRRPYAWPGLDPDRVLIVPPGIDPGSGQNRDLDPAEHDRGRAALTCGRLSGGPVLDDHGTGWLSRSDTPFVLQVSRWDPLKGHAGVLAGFARLLAGQAAAHPGLELVLAGPYVDVAGDYRQSVVVLEQLLAAHAELPPPIRRQAHIWTFAERGAAYEPLLVNVLQRSARVVVQNSLREGFGLTVTEALWKRAAVLASAVGGLAEQVEDGVTGVLTTGTDGDTRWTERLAFALTDDTRRRAWGAAGHRRVAGRYLASTSLRLQLEAFGLAP